MNTSYSSQTFVIPSQDALSACRSKLLHSLPQNGLGLDSVKTHLEEDITPGLNRSSQSSNFYGFVTGGATSAAKFADNIVTEFDQFVQIHQPNDTIATEVEAAALDMLCDLMDLSPQLWQHRTFTTGATASNIVGLACGREFIVAEAARRNGNKISVAEDGIFGAMHKAGVDSVQILTTVPHSSLRKAASILGLGHNSVKELGLFNSAHHFDFTALEAALSAPKTASIIVISCAEVNTGLFATSASDMHRLRSLADTYSAWVHVDAAFGLQARCLPRNDPTLSAIVSGVSGIELADSITGDAHKLLNVPYDCGIFLSKHLVLGTQVFQNVGAAYLTSPSLASSIPSPLNIGIENSRRFRALPVYATLAAYGRSGHQRMLYNQIHLARSIASFISAHPKLELLPDTPTRYDYVGEQGLSSIYMIVLFRAVDERVNAELVKSINGTRKIFVSGTQWEGKPAARFAVANWQVEVERDLRLVKEVLHSVL